MALKISFNDRRIVLPTGQLFIGRSADCHVVVDDPLASRRHAVLTMSKSGAFVTDLGSKAGVRVNGEMVTGARRLARGDVILIASLRIGVDEVSVDADDEPTDPRLRSTISPPASHGSGAFRLRPTPPLGIPRVDPREPSGDTMDDEEAPSSNLMRTQEAPRVVIPPGDAPAPRTAVPPPRPSALPGETTDSGRGGAGSSGSWAALTDSRVGRLPPLPSFPRGETLRALAVMGEKTLALGRADEAERILQRALLETRDAARRGEAEAAIVELAATLGAKLAAATGSGRWFDFVIGLYATCREVPPASVVDGLHTAVRKVKTIDKAAFRDYVALVKNAPGDSPARRFLLQRLDGLRPLVDLK